MSGNVLTFQLYSYNPTTGTWTNHVATVDTTGKLPAGVTAASIASSGIVAGAVDPLSGNFYWANYANAPTNAMTIFGWNTTTNTSIGVVATSTMPETIPPTTAGVNGDLAFDSKGNLYVVSSVNTFAATGVIPGPLPTTPPTTPPALPDTTLTTYSNPNSNAYNGIAFDNTGSLYLEYSSTTGNTTSILKIDPNTGAILAGPATVTGSAGTIGVDLGACSVPPVMELQKNVINRQADTDQFMLSITGGGITGGNTATTSGTANGVQSAVAGPVLGVTGTTYTFTETGSGTTTIANYTTTWQCIDEGNNNTVIASGTGQSFNLTLPPPATGETGQFIVCTFTNSAPRLVVTKSAVPPSNTWVDPGQSITYTLTFDNSGGGQPAAVDYTDDLTQVLDDATVTTPPALATGTGLTVGPITAGTFTVTGTLAAGATATVTYTVRVNNPDTGDHQLVNFVVPTGTTPPSTCLPSNPACTIHFVASTPGFTTAIVPPSDTSVGNTWGDTATVSGNSTGGPPTGTVSWTFCQAVAPATTCTGGTSIGSTSTSTSSGNDSIFTLPNPQTPTAVGTYCFNASFAATPGGHYLSVAQQSGDECFTVTPAPSSSTTTASPSSVVIGPTGTVTDSVTVTGNSTGGAPTGTVAFTVCGPLAGPALCPSGTAVPPPAVPLTPGTGITSSATSGAFTPTAVGTWCFAAVYAPASNSAYLGSSDNISGTPSDAECFSVGAATPGFTTTIVPPSDTAVGNTWGDTATVSGNSTGGAPTGTVSWTLCQAVAPETTCAGGTDIGSDDSPTSSGDDSTFTLPNPQTPTAVGTYCFNASFAATPGGSYSDVAQQSGDECFEVTPATPGFTTTIVPPSDTAVGNAWGDTATVSGNPTGGPPTGTVSWTICQAVAPATTCTGGTDIGSDDSPTSSGNDSIFALPNQQSPKEPGTYCFNASFAATLGGNYADVAQQTGTECFTVTPAPSSSTTTRSLSSVVIGPSGTVTDSVTVTGNSTGGAPTGTVAFTVCGPLAGTELCPSGSAVPPTPVDLTPATGITSSATSGTFTPTSVGTWCFAAVYTPASNSAYLGSSDNIAGTASDAECVTVTPATPGFITTLLSPVLRTAGNPWGDTATVSGNSIGGPPTGTVTWTFCQAVAPETTCTGGDDIGSTSTSTSSGNDSIFTLPNPQTPTEPGTYCFNASFAATSGGNYENVPQQSDTECFTVTSTVTTTSASPSSVVIGPTGTVTDSVTVTGNSTGGAPTGSVDFTVCGPLPGPALCPDGTAVPPTPVTLSPSTSDASSATSGTFTPTSVGTWCFAAAYTPASNSTYLGSSDNISGTPSSAECFSVGAAAPGFTTTIVPPDINATPVGHTWGDTATVSGNSIGGPPTGTVSWTFCQAVAPATSCTGGTSIGSTTTSTPSGNDSTFTLPNPQTPTAGGTYCFNASFTATSGGNYSDVAQQSGTECFTVNFTVTKTVAGGSGTPFNPGAVVTYTIVVENLGGQRGSAVVTDTIPPQLTLTAAPSCAVTAPDATPPDVCTVTNTTGSTWTFSVTLEPNHTATVILSATVAPSATGTVTNTATITDGPCIESDACSSSVSNPINATAPVTPPTAPTVVPPAVVPPAVVSPITPTRIQVTG